MQCPNCQTNNPNYRKFCRECGKKLLLLCPQCGTENLPGDKFCGECGQNLSISSDSLPKDLSFDEKLNTIQKYLPKGLTEKILAQKGKIEGERKQVTVMFCDMEGFTALVDKLGPEEAYSIMDQIYEILIHKVHDYEGIVNEMTGDGIMALFGAPIALEDAPQRAIQSSLAIHREMAKFNDRIKQDNAKIPSLKMRIGIHTGPVVVGTLGNDLRVEFKAVGDTVNLSSRVEGLAAPGTTYVTDDTFKLTEGLFRFEALGQKKIKGKEKPIKLFRVISTSTRRTKFDVSAETGLTPFIGRERELEILLDGFERSKTGQGQAFSILSEAGVGKSRLLYEFRKAMANEDVTFMEGKCLSYSRVVAYYPVIDIVKSTFDIVESDGESRIKEKIQLGLRTLAVDESSTLPYLLELLGVKGSGLNPYSLSSEAKKDRIVRALIRITIKASHNRPLIMAIEDLHWIDKSSEDSLKALLERISGEKIFLIFTYRPEYKPTWGVRSYHSQVNLNRLYNRESLAMAIQILGTNEINTDLEKLILEKTEGAPFFIEEFIKTLIDIGAIKREGNSCHLKKNIQDVAIPSTIQDVIMARVDSLPETAKEVIKTGSVIEREFNYRLIKEVTSLSKKELLLSLSNLRDSDLLFEREVFPDSIYIFKHTLTREVVYNSLLTSKKKELHEKIGNSIEHIYKLNIKEQCEFLAEHFIQSENSHKGAEYSRMASRKAVKAGAFRDAVGYGKKEIVCLESMSKTDDLQNKIIDARTAVGLFYLQQNYFVEAKKAIDPIVDLAIKQNYNRKLAHIYTILGAYYHIIEENFSNASKLLINALKISESEGDFLSLANANYFLGTSLSLNCDFKNALYHLEKALEINLAGNARWGVSVVKSSISYFIHYLQGAVDLCYQSSKEAVQLAEESGDIFSKGASYTSYGISCYGKGFFEEAKTFLTKGVDFSGRANIIVWKSLAQFFLAETCSDIGEYQISNECYGKVIPVEQKRLFPSWNLLIKIGISRVEIMDNERIIDIKFLYNYMPKNRAKIYEGWMRRYIGEILLYGKDQHISEAEDWILKAIKYDLQNGMMLHLGRDYALYGELFRRKGNISKAKEKFNKAIGILQECGADGWVEKYENYLASLP